MQLCGRHLLMVVAPTDYRDEELAVPRRLFEAAGARVTVASTRTGGTRGMRGGRAVALAAIDRVRVDDVDAVLIVGGDGARVHLWDHAGLLTLVRQAQALGKLLGAICLAPVVLARAGLVTGGEVSVWRSPEALAELDRCRVRAAAAEVTVAGRIVTANGPEAAQRWASAIIAALTATR
jgi:protease I